MGTGKQRRKRFYNPAKIVDAPEHHALARSMGLLTIGTWEHQARSVSQRIEDFVRAFQIGSSSPFVPEAFLERAIQESAKLPAQLWIQVLRELIASGPVPEMERTAVPVYVIGGVADSVFSADEQRALARAIPHAQLRLEPGIGHALHWEKPELFVELMDKAMSQLTLFHLHMTQTLMHQPFFQ